MKSALVIGDSHVAAGNPFGQALERELAAAGYQVTRAGVVGSSAKGWLEFDPLCSSVDGKCLRPSELPTGVDLLLISLGTNDAAGGVSPGQAAAIVERVGQLAKHYAAGRTVWIAPPWLGDTWPTATNTMMAPLYEAALHSPLEVFDSRPATRELVTAGSGDGVHVGPAAGDAWAKAVRTYLERRRVLPWVLAGVGALLVGVVVWKILSGKRGQA